MPKKCPVCETCVYKEGAYTVCPAGLSCAAQLVERGFLVFSTRSAFDTWDNTYRGYSLKSLGA